MRRFYLRGQKQLHPQQIIEFAVAAGSMKYTVMGDYNCVSAEEVAALAFGKKN